MTIKNIIESIPFDPKNPNNIRLCHGTTSVGKDDILHKRGFRDDMGSIWSCSEYDKAYFYELKRFAKCEGKEDESLENIQYELLLRANENAQIQEAILKNPGTMTYVIEFVLPPEANQFIEDDDSCDNMINYGSVQMDTIAINHFIRTGNCCINVYHFNFFPKMAYFYIAGLINNEFAQVYFEGLGKEEACAIEAINKADTYEIFEAIVLEVEPKFDGYINHFDPDCYR